MKFVAKIVKGEMCNNKSSVLKIHEKTTTFLRNERRGMMKKKNKQTCVYCFIAICDTFNFVRLLLVYRSSFFIL